jgi:hypothetical protein
MLLPNQVGFVYFRFLAIRRDHNTFSDIDFMDNVGIEWPHYLPDPFHQPAYTPALDAQHLVIFEVL